MSWGKVVFRGSKVVGNVLRKRWKAIVSPETTIQLQQLEVVAKAQGIRQKEREGVLKSADQLRKLYKELGVPEDVIRDRIESMIATETDPLSVIGDLASRGKVRLPPPPP